jgi:hypothetical protein
MMHRLIRWFLVVMPPSWATALFLLAYSALTACLIYVTHILKDADSMVIVRSQRDVVVLGAFVLLAVYRATFFHPLFREKYREWLMIAPWNASKRLPAGPIHLVFQDLVIVAIGIALLWDGKYQFLPSMYLSSYLLILTVAIWSTGIHGIGYVLVFALGLALRLRNDTAYSLVVLLISYAIANLGLRYSLQRFPWENEFPRMKKFVSMRDSKATGKDLLGWPFGVLTPKRGITTATIGHITIHVILIIWLGHAALFDARPTIILALLAPLCFVISSAAAVGRVFMYCRAHHPPINLWGRIFTFRWIIPRYDYVFIGPLCMVLFGATLPAALYAIGLGASFCVPIGLAAVYASAVLIGPSFDTWQLTGNHRVNPALVIALQKRFLVEV